MGDEIKLLDVNVIQGGLLQLDFLNVTENKGYRCFCESSVFFGKLGRSLAFLHDEWEKKEFGERINEKDQAEG